MIVKKTRNKRRVNFFNKLNLKNRFKDEILLKNQSGRRVWLIVLTTIVVLAIALMVLAPRIIDMFAGKAAEDFGQVSVDSTGVDLTTLDTINQVCGRLNPNTCNNRLDICARRMISSAGQGELVELVECRVKTGLNGSAFAPPAPVGGTCALNTRHTCINNDRCRWFTDTFVPSGLDGRCFMGSVPEQVGCPPAEGCPDPVNCLPAEGCPDRVICRAHPFGSDECIGRDDKSGADEYTLLKRAYRTGTGGVRCPPQEGQL